MAEQHPAPYSPEVLARFRVVIPQGTHVHDPFAGAGLRLGKLADECFWTFSGTELEAPFIVDPRVVEGNACDKSTYPRKRGFWIVTSPVYPNGIADDFNAQDGSERRTYRSTRAAIVGHDEPLHPDNQGRWGYRGTKSLASTKRAMYWNIATRSVQCWARADAVLLNVSDFKVGERTEPVVSPWLAVLSAHGWEVQRSWDVHTRRYRNGVTRGNRTDAEKVVLLRRAVS